MQRRAVPRTSHVRHRRGSAQARVSARPGHRC